MCIVFEVDRGAGSKGIELADRETRDVIRRERDDQRGSRYGDGVTRGLASGSSAPGTVRADALSTCCVSRLNSP